MRRIATNQCIMRNGREKKTGSTRKDTKTLARNDPSDNVGDVLVTECVDYVQHLGKSFWQSFPGIKLFCMEGKQKL